MKKLVAITLVAVGLPAFADQVIHLPNGGTCFMAPTGHVYGCSGGVSPPVAPVREDGARSGRAKQSQLADCLRKADWPGFPGSQECYRMFGDN